ncbi:cytochrome P450 6k1 [Halyomorpha halys]|uniref:cytochrome P450 6k1 n=1 Tax=Halyomorpha halys TaxID=286706 RepID=UPI0006D4E68D|nr:cytochrome P450 6k1-like [Halyomorpha halys]
MLPIVISLLIVTIYFFYKYWVSIYDRWEKNGIPSIPGKFPYGSSPEMDKRFPGQVVQEMYHKMSEHPYFGIYLVRVPWLVVRDPEIIRLVMTKEFNHFRDRFIHKFPESDKMSQHLFNLSGERWRALRVKLTPTFTSGKLKGMFPLFKSCAESLENSLKSKVGSELDMKQFCGGYTTDTISSCAFGLEPKTIDNPDHDIRTLFKFYAKSDYLNKLLIAAAKAFPTLESFVRRVPIEIEDFLIKLVSDTIEQREKNDIKRNDFMELLIQLKNKGTLGDGLKEEITQPFEINIDILTAQVFVFLFAGMETSSSVQNWCLYELALQQDIQQRLREEIDRVLEKHGEVSYQAIQEMEYLHMVISETMRKYPTIPSLRRVCTTPFSLPSGDRIETGDNILIPVFAIQRDPQYYPDPEKFDPERFSPENIGSIKPYTYLPFGEGPRICIGNRFGLMQTKMGVMTVIRNFKVIPCDDTPTTIEFLPVGEITFPKKHFPIKLVAKD